MLPLNSEILSQDSAAQNVNFQLYFNTALLEAPSVSCGTEPTIVNPFQATEEGLEISAPTTDDFVGGRESVPQARFTQKSRADVVADAIHAAVDSTPEGSSKPTSAAIAALTKLLAVVPDSVLGEPDVDVFRSEIHLQWGKGAREIVLMAFSKDKEPLVHHYERVKGKASEHGIEQATATSLKNWLRWLNG